MVHSSKRGADVESLRKAFSAEDAAEAMRRQEEAQESSPPPARSTSAEDPQHFREKSTDDLLVILQNREDYRSEVVAIAADEMRKRGVDVPATHEIPIAPAVSTSSQPGPSRLRKFLLSLLTVVLTFLIGTFIGLYLAGATRLGIFVPIVLYLCAAVIGWPIGWLLGALFRKGKTIRRITSYVLGFAWVAVSGYLSTIDQLVMDYRDAVKIERPLITESEWLVLRESAEQQASPIAAQKAVELVVIVLGWVCLYWCIKMLIRKLSRQSSPTSTPKMPETI